MTKQPLALALVLGIAASCAQGAPSLAEASAPVAVGASCRGDGSKAAEVLNANFQGAPIPELVQPPSVRQGPDAAAGEVVERLPPTDGLTLDSLEQMALASNPAIGQAAARIRALQGKWVQAGLPPNPTAGYAASEIGGDGSAGQQGGFVGQQFITANKLQRDQAIVAAEISRAEQEFAVARRRVLTDVRRDYYLALLAQRRASLAQDIVQVTSQAVAASQALLQAEEIPLAGLLQTEVQQQNAQVLLRTSQNAAEQAWRSLSATVGAGALPPQPLEGDVTQLPGALDWEAQLVRVQRQSPEIAAAFAEVQRARRALNRARVEAVPDISTQLTVQYDDGSDETIAGVQIGLPIPLWNRNQGGIRQAQAEVTRAALSLQRVELDLNQRLADAFRRYSDAHVTAETYAGGILPRSRRTLDLVRQAYEQGEVGYLDLLTAQQTFSQTNLAYIEALGELWQSFALIDGLLLDGSLQDAGS